MTEYGPLFVGAGAAEPDTSAVADVHEPDRLDKFDRDLLKFALLWAPYGGPPADELFPEFGITSQQLVPRIRAIVTQYVHRPICRSDRGLLLQAMQHLRHLVVPKGPPNGRGRRL